MYPAHLYVILGVDDVFRNSLAASYINLDNWPHLLAKTITECWDPDEETRLGAATVNERIDKMCQLHQVHS